MPGAIALGVLGMGQRLPNIRDQIRAIFKPNAQPHQTSGDAQVSFLLRRQTLVGGGCRMRCNRFGIA